MANPAWHDPSCKGLDLAHSSGGLRSCMRCGSFQDSLLPLIRQQTEFRLLRIHPGTFEQPVECDIVVHDLASVPEYEAISYTWGDEFGNADRCATVFVDGRSFLVTANCENALKRVRKPNESRRVWIDAVCIDQSSHNERGHQVQIMPRIYSKAQRVLVYVGESSAADDDLLDNIWHEYTCNHHPKFLHNNEQSARAFLKRRYFQRIWILQEVSLSRSATLLCGDKSISWRLFSRGCHELLGWEVSAAPVLDLHRQDATTFLQLLDKSRPCQAADPRDKVYALLGMAADPACKTLTPNYNLDVAQVYADLAIKLAELHGWVSILRRAGLVNSPTLALPSWVPDWSHTQAPELPEYSDLEELQLRDVCSTIQVDPTALSLSLKLVRLLCLGSNMYSGNSRLLKAVQTHFSFDRQLGTSTELWLLIKEAQPLRVLAPIFRLELPTNKRKGSEDYLLHRIYFKLITLFLKETVRFQLEEKTPYFLWRILSELTENGGYKHWEVNPYSFTSGLLGWAEHPPIVRRCQDWTKFFFYEVPLLRPTSVEYSAEYLLKIDTEMFPDDFDDDFYDKFPLLQARSHPDQVVLELGKEHQLGVSAEHHERYVLWQRQDDSNSYRERLVGAIWKIMEGEGSMEEVQATLV